jgi:thiol-disulfide isomerase/thioredoxin
MEENMRRKSMKTMKATVFLALILVFALGFAACGADKKADSGAAAGNSTEEAAEDTAAADSAVGNVLLNAKTKDVNGGDFDVSANKGSVLTVFNVWATWCSPCIEELPSIEKVAKKYESKNVRVIGVLADGVGDDGKIDELSCKEAKTLLADAKVSYPSIIPDEAMMNGLIASTQALPTTFIIGPNGELVDKIVGGMDYDAWDKAVGEALKS